MISNQAPPEEFFNNLPIPELVKACRRAMRVAVKKHFLHRAIEELSDELDDYEFDRLREQVDIANGLVGLIIRKRSEWLNTGPVTNGR